MPRDCLPLVLETLMPKHSHSTANILKCWAIALLLCACLGSPARADTGSGYAELVGLFKEFREFVAPDVIDGVPDYSREAMAAQLQALQDFRNRLHAIDDSSWTIAERADYLLVLAEMRGLEFQHRVIKPWAKDPAFYSTTNLGFGPKMHGALAIPDLPITEEAAKDLLIPLRAVPDILEQARRNLTDARGDLARLGIQQKRIEKNVYERLSVDTAERYPELATAASAAADATASFIEWLQSIQSSLPPHGGIGRENYDWYLRHVLLFPYSWEQMRILGEREYQRSMVFLKLEENRHAQLPMIAPATSMAEFERRRAEADRDLLRFLEAQDIMTVPEWLVPPVGEGPYVLPADRDPKKPGPFDAPIERHFFRQTEDRDPRPLRAHNLPGHQLDQMMLSRDEHPIRGERRLFFISGTRMEGWAFYLEELIQQTGFLDDRPKAREINYILQAKRAARVLPELKLHDNSWTYEEALASLTSRTPYWMGPDDAIAKFDLELYLRQPGYGIGYYMGKVQLEELFAEVAAQRGREFDLREFHDEFLSYGVVPISLIRWQMLGQDDQVKRMR